MAKSHAMFQRFRRARSPPGVVLQCRMHDFVRQASKQFRRRQLRNEFRVIEQGDSIGRHGVDRWSLNVLEPQDQDPEEWEIEQQFRPALLEPHGWGEICHDAISSM